MTSTGRTRPDRLLGLAGMELALVVAGFLVPLTILIAYAFGRSDPLTFDVTVIGTLDPFRKLFSETYRPVVVRSLTLAMITVVACVGVGTPAALALSRLPERRSRMILLAVVAPAFVSFTVRIHGWSNLLSSEGVIAQLTGTSLLFRPAGVAVGMFATYLPLYILPVALALGRVDEQLCDAAADLGAPPGRATRTVVLPLARPGIVAGAVLVGVLAIGEYIVPTVLGGGRVLLLGNLLNDQAGGRDQPLGGAIAVVILSLALLGGLVARLAMHRSR